MKFSTKPEALKDKSFERICINGTPTSYTTTMGPTWTEDWFVLREIYCNALDEETCTLIPETGIVQPSAGKTRIYIELTDSLKKVALNWNNYFSIDRTPLLESPEIYTCYIGQSDGAIDQKVTVFQKTDGVLYRRGIRVYDNKEFLFDYGLNHVDINEDRTAKNGSAMNYVVRNLMAMFVSEDYVKSVLQGSQQEKTPFEYLALNSDVREDFSPKWIDFCKNYLVVSRDKSGRYTQEMNSTHKEVFLIPTSFARELKKKLPACSILGMSNVSGNFSYHDVDTTPKMDFLLKEVLNALTEMKYHTSFPIKVVEFDRTEVMGHADMQNKTILLASSTFDKGRREIALTIMEETEHLISQKPDECRAFETHIFSQWLKSMEESNAIFL